MKKELVMCLYEATGARFFTVYENGVDKMHISSSLFPYISRVFISGSYGEFESVFDMESTIVPGLKRAIETQDGVVAAVLTWNGDSTFTLSDGETDMLIVSNESRYVGSIGKTEVFSAEPLSRNSLSDNTYKKSGYDLLRGYKISLKGNVSESIFTFAAAFPMLKFAAW